MQITQHLQICTDAHDSVQTYAAQRQKSKKFALNMQQTVMPLHLMGAMRMLVHQDDTSV